MYLALCIEEYAVLAGYPIAADTIQAFDAQCNHAGNAEQVILGYFETNYSGVTTRKMLAT